MQHTWQKTDWLKQCWFKTGSSEIDAIEEVVYVAEVHSWHGRRVVFQVTLDARKRSCDVLNALENWFHFLDYLFGYWGTVPRAGQRRMRITSAATQVSILGRGHWSVHTIISINSWCLLNRIWSNAKIKLQHRSSTYRGFHNAPYSDDEILNFSRRRLLISTLQSVLLFRPVVCAE